MVLNRSIEAQNHNLEVCTKPEYQKYATKKVPPFLLTFDIFHRNVYNCMINSKECLNVIHVSVCIKLNTAWESFPTQIVQLDRSRLKVLGELKNLVLTLSIDPRIHQIVDIVVADVPETYGMWLRKGWSEKLKGYFSTDWSHLWFPYNGRPNQININRESLMKHTITDLNDPIEPASFVNSVVEQYTFDSYFGDLPTDISVNQNVDKLSEIGNCKVIPFVGDILHNVYNVNTNFRLYLSSWTLFF